MVVVVVDDELVVVGVSATVQQIVLLFWVLRFWPVGSPDRRERMQSSVPTASSGTVKVWSKTPSLAVGFSCSSSAGYSAPPTVKQFRILSRPDQSAVFQVAWSEIDWPTITGPAA